MMLAPTKITTELAEKIVGFVYREGKSLSLTEALTALYEAPELFAKRLKIVDGMLAPEQE